ncbi:MAG: peptidoglycan editing factor PgeF [Saccharofermentanales bacterium]
MISHLGADGVEYLTFKSLEDLSYIRHAFSTRVGGISDSVYKSMNLGFSRGDDPQNVLHNFNAFCGATGIDIHSLVFGAQTHSTNVRRVYAADRGSGIDRPVPWTDTDGLATSDPDVFLATFYADCVPLYFIDTVKRAVALSHAGWRGTVSGMAAATIRLMVSEFGSSPSDIQAAIGPSIGRCCFEVGQEVADEFDRLPGGFTDGCIRNKTGAYEGSPAKYRIDLKEINRRMMIGSGILPEHIEVADICTSCNSEWLFSHRASDGERGSLCAVLGIAE